jgi:hypothetical protein
LKRFGLISELVQSLGAGMASVSTCGRLHALCTSCTRGKSFSLATATTRLGFFFIFWCV